MAKPRFFFPVSDISGYFTERVLEYIKANREREKFSNVFINNAREYYGDLLKSQEEDQRAIIENAKRR